jgi:hypothetical protein
LVTQSAEKYNMLCLIWTVSGERKFGIADQKRDFEMSNIAYFSASESELLPYVAEFLFKFLLSTMPLKSVTEHRINALNNSAQQLFG